MRNTSIAGPVAQRFDYIDITAFGGLTATTFQEQYHREHKFQKTEAVSFFPFLKIGNVRGLL